MRFNKFLVLAALAIGFVSCTKDNPNKVDPKTSGDTYVSLRLMDNGTSAATKVVDSQADWGGRVAEAKVTTLKMVSTTGNAAWAEDATSSTLAAAGAGKFIRITNYNGTNNDALHAYPVVATAGQQLLAVLANGASLTLPAIANVPTYVKPFAAYTTDIADLATDNAFVMTSARAQVTVNKNVTEDDAKSATVANPAKNCFLVKIERVVCQGRVAFASSYNPSAADGSGSVDDATYAAVNGAAYTYLFADNAGERTIQTDGSYGTYKSAIHDELNANPENNENPATVAGKLVRLGNVSTNMAGQGLYASKSVLAYDKRQSTADADAGIYFMENSCGGKNNANWENIKDYGFWRLAQAKVYGYYVPTKIYGLRPDPLSPGDSILTLLEVVAEGTTLTNDPAVPARLAGTRKVENKWAKKSNFYLGEHDGVIYEDKAAARASVLYPGQNAYKYENAKCGWRALWNRQTNATETDKVDFAETRRNNTYLLMITGFKTIGFPYDPSDPEDPNLPEPDPDDPTDPDPDPDPDPDIEPKDTYMSVIAEILPWNFVERTIQL